MTDRKKEFLGAIMDTAFKGRYTYDEVIPILEGLAKVYREECNKRAMGRRIYQEVYDVEKLVAAERPST